MPYVISTKPVVARSWVVEELSEAWRTILTQEEINELDKSGQVSRYVRIQQSQTITYTPDHSELMPWLGKAWSKLSTEQKTEVKQWLDRDLL